jgi:hypothetical protein
MSSMEIVAQSMGFKTHIRNYKVNKILKLFLLTCTSMVTEQSLHLLDPDRRERKRSNNM